MARLACNYTFQGLVGVRVRTDNKLERDQTYLATKSYAKRPVLSDCHLNHLRPKREDLVQTLRTSYFWKTYATLLPAN